MTSERVGRGFEVGVEPGFKWSMTAADDNGSMETDAGAVVNARNVTGSVAIS